MGGWYRITTMLKQGRAKAFGLPAASAMPPRQLTEAQLECVLASKWFSRSESLSRFLRHIVRLAIAGETDRLKEYCVGVEVFDRGPSFDPKCDSIVRTQASKLRSRLDEYYASAGARDSIRIELPRGSYVPIIMFQPQT